jgi:ATP-binding cassette subfamily B protein/subfamily B ATP-binding cassette protein MsbA
VLRLTFRLLRLLRGHRRRMALALVCGLGFTLCSLGPPLIVRDVIRRLVDGGGSPEQLTGQVLLLGAVAVLRGWTRYAEAIVSHAVAYRVQHDLVVEAYAHLQRLSHRFFAERRSGELASRLAVDVNLIEVFVAHAIALTAQAILVPLAMIAFLLYLDWRLALVALVPLPVAAWVAAVFLPPARGRWQRLRAKLGEMSATVQENIAGMTVIKAFGRERERLAALEAQSRGMRDDFIRAQRVSMIPLASLETLAVLGLTLVIWQGGLRAFGGELSAADLFVFVFCTAQIYQPLLHLTALNEGLGNAFASAERIFSVLDAEPDVVDPPQARAPSGVRWTVRYEDVRFGYEPGAPVLRGLSFGADEGETVALVGMTGAGKSTATSLLPRFYDVQGGAVRIGDHDVRELPLGFVRASVALVLQDVFLFHGTVRDNLLLGRPDATEAEVVAAARAANAHEFVVRLPGGYDAMVGERGVRLSGGEKQRLSIARALLKDAPILILDEATSSVDAETEGLIQEALARLTLNRTTIVIAHRLSTIRSADRIVVLDRGRAAETGTHDELVARGGLYAAMERAHRTSRDWTVSGNQPGSVASPPPR